MKNDEKNASNKIRTRTITEAATDIAAKELKLFAVSLVLAGMFIGVGAAIIKHAYDIPGASVAWLIGIGYFSRVFMNIIEGFKEFKWAADHK